MFFIILGKILNKYFFKIYFIIQIKIKMNYKNITRSLLNFLHLDLTKNLKYDRLTKLIMKKVIKTK